MDDHLIQSYGKSQKLELDTQLSTSELAMMLSLPTQIIPDAGASTEVTELSQSARSTSDSIAKRESALLLSTG
jgi:hypothetical protein